jgi:hypothetical protein
MVEKEDVVTAWLMIIDVWRRRQKGCSKLDCNNNALHSTPLSIICEAENGNQSSSEGPRMEIKVLLKG